MVELCEALLSQTTSVPANAASVFSVVKNNPRDRRVVTSPAIVTRLRPTALILARSAVVGETSRDSPHDRYAALPDAGAVRTHSI